MSDTFGPSTVRPVARPLDRPIRLGVLISGGGTTLVNLQEKIRTGRLNAEVSVIVASRAESAGLTRAAAEGLECRVVSRGSYQSVREFSDAVFDLLRMADVDLVVLAGFLSLLEIPDDFRFRVLNIHPSLIPAFCGHGFFGHRVHEAAIGRGVKISGCTVHFADNEYDHGPIILQRSVCIPDGATPDELASLVFEQECEAYPEAIRLFALGRIVINGRCVSILHD